MKKSIIALIALAGMATATDKYSGDFAWGSDNTPLTFTFETGSPFTIESLTCDKTYKSTNVHSETLTPDINIGNTAGASWTLSFTLTNTSTEAIHIKGLELEVFLFNGGGNAQSADNFARPITLTLATEGTTLVTQEVATAGGATAWESKPVLSLVNGQGDWYVMEAGDSIDLTLTVTNAQTGDFKGTFVGMTGASVVVPEPTTATLSLLALAGLAVRRRRK